jgi:hypoxanthine-DNA glycosylase
MNVKSRALSQRCLEKSCLKLYFEIKNQTENIFSVTLTNSSTALMTKLKGFPPIASKNAEVLILGSMPSETSLLKQQYYGHPRNAFWPIMGALFAALPELAYDQRKAILMKKKIAVWDVLKTCNRPGSMDASIEMNSIETNDFTAFFVSQPSLKNVFFNGGKAENVYKKHIEPELLGCFDYIHYQRLPSTSPAFASMSLQQKITAWQILKDENEIT